MDGLPVTIRLLDPPLHEFLPDLTELSVRVAVAEERGEQDEGTLRLLAAVQAMHEQNPMLGPARGPARASSCPACSPCRCGRSRRRRPSARRPAATRGRRS